MEGSKKDGNSNAEKSKDSVLIRVIDQTGSELQFRVKNTTKFAKVFKVYSERKGIDQKSIRFLYNGHRIESEETPGSLEMEDEDMIDAVLEMVGGFHNNINEKEHSITSKYLKVILNMIDSANSNANYGVLPITLNKNVSINQDNRKCYILAENQKIFISMNKNGKNKLQNSILNTKVATKQELLEFINKYIEI